MRPTLLSALLAALLLPACDRPSAAQTGAAASPPAGASAPAAGSGATPFAIAEVASFDEPWAVAPLPDGRMLVTEKKGHLQLVGSDGGKREVSGVPAVDYGGQGGLGDVVLHPQFTANQWIYLSYAEAGDGGRGAAVARARLVESDGAARLDDVQVVWRQSPKRSGRGHYGHRIAFGSDGKLWISSGDRQEFTPAQDMRGNLGKVLRLEDDGRPAADNPFAAQGGVAAQVWSLGHRNPLGLAFAPDGRLWELEMGPEGGDELNLVQRGKNYGWPEVSDGDHYDGRDIPDHSTSSKFEVYKVNWTPVIAPGDLLIYSGSQFPQWQGDALIAGLKSEAIVHVDIDGEQAREAARYPMGKRIRAIRQAPDGALLVLEDGPGGRLLKLSNPPAE
jgi:glucose/arabinose dehydrogenase